MRRLVVVCVLALTAPVAFAQDDLTKREIIDRSAAICRDLNDAAIPHLRGLNRAERPRGVLKHGRRFIKTSRPYVRDLRDLIPAEGARRYRRFVNNTDTALDWLAAALNAVEARRGNLAERRLDEVGKHTRRAKAAARRYGLRRSCLRYVG